MTKSIEGLVLWRGTENKIDDPAYLGVNNGYISTSLDINVAKKFTSSKYIDTGLIEDADIFSTLYKMNIDPGIPLLYMEKFSEIKNEKEVLLPRDCLVELLDTYYIENTLTHEVRVSYNFIENVMNLAILE